MRILKPRKYTSNSDIKNDYNKQGFVSIKNYINKKDLIEIKNDINKVCKSFYKKKDFLSLLNHLDKTNKKKLHLLHVIITKINSLRILNSNLSKFNKIIFPKKNIFYIDDGLLLGLSKDKRLTYEFHQETNYMKGFDDILNIHYPIFHKSNLKNGSMSALLGSHKMGKLEFKKSRISDNSFTNLLPKNISNITKKYEEVLFELEVGDVVFFDKDLIHKSNFNYSSKPRPVGIGRFSSTLGNFSLSSPDDL